MSSHDPAFAEMKGKDVSDSTFMETYLDTLTLLERLHRLLLDAIKDEFERVGLFEVNSVQALLMFNIGDKEVTAGELKSRGYYQGSNVSYNLKKLVDAGYMHHRRSDVDRRSVRVGLTEKGLQISCLVGKLFRRHAEGLLAKEITDANTLNHVSRSLQRMERYWAEQIRYIY